MEPGLQDFSEVIRVIFYFTNVLKKRSRKYPGIFVNSG